MIILGDLLTVFILIGIAAIVIFPYIVGIWVIIDQTNATKQIRRIFMEERKNISYLMQGVEGDEDENIDPNPPPPPPPDTDETPGTPPIGHTNES